MDTTVKAYIKIAAVMLGIILFGSLFSHFSFFEYLIYVGLILFICIGVPLIVIGICGGK